MAGMVNILKQSFTLVELMIVIVVIGIIAALSVPRLNGRADKTRYNTAVADVQTSIPMALKLYEFDTGSYPSTSQGLRALYEKQARAQKWNGPYLDYKPVDPWGQEYNYIYPSLKQANSYDLWSNGPDRISGSEDDIKNW